MIPGGKYSRETGFSSCATEFDSFVVSERKQSRKKNLISLSRCSGGNTTLGCNCSCRPGCVRLSEVNIFSNARE